MEPRPEKIFNRTKEMPNLFNSQSEDSKQTALRKKAHEYLKEHQNATWDAFQTHIMSKAVIYTINSEICLIPLPIRIPNSTLWSNRLKDSLRYWKSNKWTKSISLVPDLRTRITNQDKIWQDSSYICRRNGHTLMSAELKLTIMRLRDSRLGTLKSVKQFSLMITIKGEDLILGRRKLRNLISNPDTEIKTIRHPIDKLPSTQTGTEIQTPIDPIIKTYQATPGTTDQTTNSKLSFTSTLDQRILILSTEKTYQNNNLSTPNWVQFVDDQGQDVVNTLSGFFPLNYWLFRDQMKKVTSNHVFGLMPSTFPLETAKKIVDSKLNSCSTHGQPVQS